MSKTPQYKQRGYPLPDVIEPEDCIGVCVPVPNDVGHIRAFLGQLDMLGYWWTWERNTSKQGREAAQVWRQIAECVRERMDLNCGCGCGDGIPKQYRYDENGNLEVSLDGGITWQDGSAYDERNLVTEYPPATPLPNDSKCLYAENIRDEIKKQIETILNNLETGGTVASAAAALLPLLVTIGFPAAPLAAFLILVYGLISVIISLIAAGVENSFDTAFWNEFKCMWYCVIDDDGQVNEDMIEAVKAAVADYFTAVNPLATKTINDTMGMLGAKALTNAARLGDSILESDCSGCDCDPEWCYEFNFLTTDGSFVNVSGSNYGNWTSGQGWVSELVPASGGQSIWIKRDFSAEITHVEIDVVWTNTNGRNIQVSTQDTALISNVGSAPLSATFEWDGIRTATQIVLNPSGGSGNVVKITRLLMRGTGTNPFGTDNCI